MKCLLLAVSLTLVLVAPAFAQADHADIARAAFEASALPPPPRSVESALPFITRLLAMLPAGEKAGYVRAPANGDNVGFLSDGTPVRVSRVMYPNGQIYKVMNDAPNGSPQWVFDDVQPQLYVAFGGPPPVVVVPPPPVVIPPPVTPPLDLTGVYAKLDALQLQLKEHDENPSWLMKLASNRFVQLGIAAFGTWYTTQLLQGKPAPAATP